MQFFHVIAALVLISSIQAGKICSGYGLDITTNADIGMACQITDAGPTKTNCKAGLECKHKDLADKNKTPGKNMREQPCYFEGSCYDPKTAGNTKALAGKFGQVSKSSLPKN
jgi:hypothetical protein